MILLWYTLVKKARAHTCVIARYYAYIEVKRRDNRTFHLNLRGAIVCMASVFLFFFYF